MESCVFPIDLFFWLLHWFTRAIFLPKPIGLVSGVIHVLYVTMASVDWSICLWSPLITVKFVVAWLRSPPVVKWPPCWMGKLRNERVGKAEFGSFFYSRYSFGHGEANWIWFDFEYKLGAGANLMVLGRTMEQIGDTLITWSFLYRTVPCLLLLWYGVIPAFNMFWISDAAFLAGDNCKKLLHSCWYLG